MLPGLIQYSTVDTLTSYKVFCYCWVKYNIVDARRQESVMFRYCGQLHHLVGVALQSFLLTE